MGAIDWVFGPKSGIQRQHTAECESVEYSPRRLNIDDLRSIEAELARLGYEIGIQTGADQQHHRLGSGSEGEPKPKMLRTNVAALDQVHPVELQEIVMAAGDGYGPHRIGLDLTLTPWSHNVMLTMGAGASPSEGPSAYAAIRRILEHGQRFRPAPNNATIILRLVYRLLILAALVTFILATRDLALGVIATVVAWLVWRTHMYQQLAMFYVRHPPRGWLDMKSREELLTERANRRANMRAGLVGGVISGPVGILIGWLVSNH